LKKGEMIPLFQLHPKYLIFGSVTKSKCAHCSKFNAVPDATTSESIRFRERISPSHLPQKLCEIAHPTCKNGVAHNRYDTAILEKARALFRSAGADQKVLQDYIEKKAKLSHFLISSAYRVSS
jgi:hypothetical protein